MMTDRLSITSDLIFFFRRKREPKPDEYGLVFKVPLATLMTEVPEDKRGGPGDGLTGAYAIPFLVFDIADCIRRRSGLDEEGLFRISAAQSALRAVKDAYNQADPVDLEAVDIHTLACILKLFFRDLPTPLIPSEHYAAFISLAEGSYTKDMAFDAKNPPPWVAEMKALVALLPHQNRLLLSFLMQLLADVVAHKDKNKMDAHNLGIVFGPAILQPPQEAATPARDLSEPNTPSATPSLSSSTGSTSSFSLSTANLSLNLGEAKVVMLFTQYYLSIFGPGLQWQRGIPPLRPGEDLISSAKREAAARIMMIDQHLEEEEQQWREREKQREAEEKKRKAEERERDRQRQKEIKEAKRRAKRLAQSALAPAENYGTLGKPQPVTESVSSFPMRTQPELEVCCNCRIS